MNGKCNVVTITKLLCNKKKKVRIKLVLLILIGISFSSFAQESSTGINTKTPNEGAVLEVFSTSKGFLPPRLTTIQRDAIDSKPAGLMIYNSDLNCLQYWNGTKWIGQCTNSGSGVFKDCSAGIVSGAYEKGEKMTAQNTLTLLVTVTEVGPWSAFSDVANGIAFSGNGIFNATGVQNITLTATGTPDASGDFAFVLKMDTSTCNKSITFKDSFPPAPDMSANPIGLKLPFTSSGSIISGTVNEQQVSATFSGYTNINTSSAQYTHCGVTINDSNKLWWLGYNNSSSSMTIKFNRSVSNLKVYQNAIDLGEGVSYVLKLNGVIVPGVIALSTAYSQNCNTQFTVSGTQITKSSGSTTAGALYNVGGSWFDEIIITHIGKGGGGTFFNFYLGSAK
ncbi:hypothetical protein LNQ49_06180 [Flavobacterium sp. F-65]|uniref:Uncharacterized protein n=1 Tax=Flavobacterium pisciphilum TaxID=2893755 RepID=A0ABS8MQZ1_9FLAO|nr:hypothetical protein [Flavobacterium sp. F-65]MCC9071179.1 hypothetical protein [Flavobacterium sp. F-65]